MATKPSDAAKAAPKRKSSGTAARRPAGAKAAPKPQPEAAAAELAANVVPMTPPTTPSAAAPDDSPVQLAAEVLKMKRLVAEVAAATGAKKPVVKNVAEAVLAVIGEALSRGQDLHLPPLGKAKVGRRKGADGEEMIVVKLKRGGGKASDKKDVTEGVAEADD